VIEEAVIIVEAVVAAIGGIGNLRIVEVAATNGEGVVVANLPRRGSCPNGSLSVQHGDRLQFH
jgi:hypothetical protein